MQHLLYDGECAFCTGFALRVAARSREIQPVAFAERERIRRLAPGLDDERLRSSFHLVDESGIVRSGPEAIPELARLALPAGAAVSWCLRNSPGSKTVLTWMYQWISEHRW